MTDPRPWPEAAVETVRSALESAAGTGAGDGETASAILAALEAAGWLRQVSPEVEDAVEQWLRPPHGRLKDCIEALASAEYDRDLWERRARSLYPDTGDGEARWVTIDTEEGV